MTVGQLISEWAHFLAELVKYFFTMPFYHYFVIARCGCAVALIALAWRARCWLLVIGLIAGLPINLETLVRLFSGFLGLQEEWKPSPPIVVVNQVLMCIELTFITTGLVVLLRRNSRSAKIVCVSQEGTPAETASIQY
jgi:hypothetical protein